jgi:TnpA family transposase
MREETFRAALASLTDAIHAEPLSAWFGDGWRASADGQAFYLGGPGEAGGVVNAHYGRDAIVKIYTTITGRQAPLHGKAISGTAGEAIHSMDGILGHESSVDIAALHVDGGGVSDITPSLILKKLSAYRQQNSLAAAFREIGRIERTLFTLRWFEDPELRRLVTAELNKGEARNSLARAVAFHRLGRFRDRGHENQSTRASALNLVTAAIILFNCRYLGRVIDAMRHSGMAFDEGLLPQLSPLGWDHINFTGDYVWSDSLAVDADGFLPLRIGAS